MQKCLIIFFVAFFANHLAKAQAIDSILAVYHDEYQPEKIHLHFDKGAYQPGETLWFKAYLMSGDGLSDYSRNFYVDWYDDQGNLLKHTIDPVFASSAKGQFDVPKNYKGKLLHLRAYTQWMLNFDSSFVYSKDIAVSPATKSAIIATAKNIPVVTLNFFPESGTLVNNINSTIGFMATNNNGMPEEMRGAIVNNRGELIDSIATVHDGMGKFLLQPTAGETYTCNWKDSYGTVHTTALPATKNTGIVIEARMLNHKMVFVVTRTEDAENNFRQLHAVASINQRLVYNATVNLNSRKNAVAEIATDDLGTGVLQLTIFDKTWIPIAERVLFLNNNSYQFKPEVNIISAKTGKREKNELEVYVPDSSMSNLSVSITDASLYTDTTSNIFSQLLLSSDIKGYIHHPAYYFSDNSNAVTQNLDLVMLTHGWRKINWEAIVQSKLPKFTYTSDSDYLQINGKVFKGVHPLPVTNSLALSLVMQAKDSSRQFFLAKINKDGSFKQRGLIFFDTTRVFYQLNDKTLQDVATITFSQSLPDLPFYRKLNPTRFSTNLSYTNDEIWYKKLKDLSKFGDTAVMLKNVTVKGNLKTPIDLLDDKYTSGLFSSKNGYAFDVGNDQRAHGAVDLFHYLQNMVPGMSMSLPILGQNGAGDANSDNAPGISWRDGTPDIFLNEMPSDALGVMNIPMSNVAYVKVFRPPFMMSSGSGASGAIAVYTKNPADKQGYVKSLTSVLVTGYSSYREFYNPDYTVTKPRSVDDRPTLYWNPYLLTDKKNKSVKIVFFNNDITQKFRLVLEGVNAEGKLARVEKIIE